MTTWPRPVPLIGDDTSAAARAEDPGGWAFPDDSVDQLAQIVAARRDIRRFRPDPVPGRLLDRVLTAAHHAPSVGHSQPWRFIVVTDPATRERAANLADTERLRQAAQLEPDAARRLLDLQLEGIREAPLGIVVCCDRRTKAQGVLGRATFTDSDMWSCAAAIQNAWLTARAAGLGLGWVTLFQPEALQSLMNLPDGVETLGWLCLGWPDERPPSPGLERAAWSRRQPLEEVVFHDRWPTGTRPQAPPSALRAPDQHQVVAARDAADALLTPGESLGVLDRAVNRVLALPTRPTTGTLILVAADHPVAAYRVSAYDPSVTRDVFEATRSGVSLGATAASAAGLRTRAVDAGVGDTADRGDLVTADAMTLDQTRGLIERGRAIGAEEATRGLVVLGEVGVANTTVAAALASLLLGENPAVTVGLGAGSDSDMLDRKRDVVTRALARAGKPQTTEEIIATLGGPDVAVLMGVTLGAAAAGAAVVLDGLLTSVAALLAVMAEPGIAASLIAGQRSRERAHGLVLEKLGLEPLLDLRTRSGEGVGGCLAAQLLLSGVRIRNTAARTEHRRRPAECDT